MTEHERRVIDEAITWQRNHYATLLMPDPDEEQLARAVVTLIDARKIVPKGTRIIREHPDSPLIGEER